jgi:hypothetical protein
MGHPRFSTTIPQPAFFLHFAYFSDLPLTRLSIRASHCNIFRNLVDTNTSMPRVRPLDIRVYRYHVVSCAPY